METKSKILIIIAALMVLLTFVFPLWYIDLEAPQYPEGIGLQIWINQIVGQNPHDLANINGLNHYIGMKEIEPESIPELTIMPYLMIFMMLFGLMAGILGKRTLVYTWILLFVIMAAIGMYDFYMWEYDYGHDLNPLAAIKIPGMAYQPPLIGSKMLLNFNAISMPHIATYILAFAVILSAVALIFDMKIKKKRKESD
jgi:copper chaperone NosL